MPEMTGFEFFRWLQNNSLGDVPFIIVSLYIADSQKDIMRKHGIAYIEEKRTFKDDLIKKIKNI